MSGLQYNAAYTLFFVPYTLLEVPSNIILKLMRPSRWISLLLFSWGLVMTLMGLVNSYRGLLAARWFLGVAESGFFPAASFLLTIWYKRYEYQRRFAVLYSMASLAGAFSGLLAFAIEKMDGIGGRTGWQWYVLSDTASVKAY
jgi:MFS family permease